MNIVQRKLQLYNFTHIIAIYIQEYSCRIFNSIKFSIIKEFKREGGIIQIFATKTAVTFKALFVP